MVDEKDSQRGFRVTDRRRFSEEGEAREGEGVSNAEPESTPAPDLEPPPTRASQAPEEPVSFSSFLLGLSTQALLHLGEIEDPASGRVERDLAAAKHVIDILGILKEKTRGNLEQPEEQLLDAALYDLRMGYVELVRGPAREGA
jgi:Domain of unknown function (DUF1844)